MNPFTPRKAKGGKGRLNRAKALEQTGDQEGQDQTPTSKGRNRVQGPTEEERAGNTRNKATHNATWGATTISREGKRHKEKSRETPTQTQVTVVCKTRGHNNRHNTKIPQQKDSMDRPGNRRTKGEPHKATGHWQGPTEEQETTNRDI